MKKILKILNILLFIIIIGINNCVFGVGRLVDIPVPPDSSGYSDFSSEDAEKKEKQFIKEQEKKNVTAEQYIGKSNNNFLKKLEIEGYDFEPEFNNQINDYDLDFKNNKISEIKIIAEPDDSKSKIEGDGIVKIQEGNDFINVNVIAENGNLNVYTIHLKNFLVDTSKPENEDELQNIIQNDNEEGFKKNNNLDYLNKKIIVTITIVIFIIIIYIILKKKGIKGKHDRRR